MKNFAVKCENSSGKPAAKWYYSQGDDTCFVTVYAKVDGESKEVLSLSLKTDEGGALSIDIETVKFDKADGHGVVRKIETIEID